MSGDRVYKGVKIMKLIKGILIVVLSGIAAMSLAGCEKEGPAEKAGKAIDEAASEVAEEIKDTKEEFGKKMAE